MSELTFEEKDVNAIREFINYVASKATFQFTTKEAYEYSKLYGDSIKILKKMEAHVFELKQIIEPKK